jgi:hypothetical protein
MVAIKGKNMKCEVNSPSILLDNEDSSNRLHEACCKPVISWGVSVFF